MARRRALCSQAEEHPQDAGEASFSTTPNPHSLPFYTALAWTQGAETCRSFQGKLDTQPVGEATPLRLRSVGGDHGFNLVCSHQKNHGGAGSGMDGQEDTKCGCV